MAKIRQEINFIDHVVTATTSTVITNEIVNIDPAQYNGTVTCRLEAVATNTNATESFGFTLFRGATPSISLSIPASTSSMTLVQGGTISLSDLTAGDYHIRTQFKATGTLTIKSVHLVIIQDVTTLTNTETQIEIGSYETNRTTETYTALANSKYWLYDSTKWDRTVKFYAEAVYDSGSMDTVSIVLQEDNGSFASWVSIASIVTAAETTVPTRTRVSFVPSASGRHYRIASLNGSMDNHDIYCAKIIVQQVGATDVLSTSQAGTAQVLGGTAGSGETSQGQGMSFTTTSAYNVVGIRVIGQKVGSPTDNLTLELFSDSITGTSLGSSDTVAASGVDSAVSGINFTFASPIALSNATKYYFRITRSGARDISNHVKLLGSTSDAYASHGLYTLSNNAWSSESATVDLDFSILDDQGITKLEPQYLLANTLFAAGTALQTFLTKWDSTEWSGVTNTYYLQADAADNSTSDVELWEADGGGSAIGTVTNIDNSQISSAMTMPASQNLDVKATTNAGDVASARILVAVVVDAAGGTAALTGTVTASITEADIVTGGKTIILTLTGDTYIAAGTGPIGTTANTQALIDGIDSAQSEATGWDAVVKPGIETTDVVRTSDTVATITLDAEATYNITATETITATIPAAVLTGAAEIVATPTFTVSPTGGAATPFGNQFLQLLGVGT